jgi:hypothetical protein
VKHLLTSVVREICTLRSVGAGARATALGHPVGTRQLVSLPRSPTANIDMPVALRASLQKCAVLTRHAFASVPRISLLRRCVMYCPSCASDAQAKFAAEINIHLGGLRNIDNPGLLVFPNLLVCLECGFSWFTTPETELALLAMCSPKRDASTRKGDGRDVAFGRTTAA